MEFETLFAKILQENNVAGGVNSAFGTNVGNTAKAVSGETYEPGNAKRPTLLYKGVITRAGMKSYVSKKNRKKI